MKLRAPEADWVRVTPAPSVRLHIWSGSMHTSQDWALQ